jgi:hypothetical protein
MIALLGATLVCAKTYKITLREAVVAGGAQLQPGQYAVKVEDGNATLVDQSGAKIDAKLHVQKGEKKAQHTTTVTGSSNGQKQLREIELSGSPDKVVFD